MEPVGQCLTPEVARRIAGVRADAELQSLMDELADKAIAGALTDAERSEYEQYISFSQAKPLSEERRYLYFFGRISRVMG